MAICTKCGAIFNDDDSSNHVCNPSDIPSPGKQKRVITNEEDI